MLQNYISEYHNTVSFDKIERLVSLDISQQIKDIFQQMKSDSMLEILLDPFESSNINLITLRDVTNDNNIDSCTLIQTDYIDANLNEVNTIENHICDVRGDQYRQIEKVYTTLHNLNNFNNIEEFANKFNNDIEFCLDINVDTRYNRYFVWRTDDVLRKSILSKTDTTIKYFARTSDLSRIYSLYRLYKRNKDEFYENFAQINDGSEILELQNTYSAFEERIVNLTKDDVFMLMKVIEAYNTPTNLLSIPPLYMIEISDELKKSETDKLFCFNKLTKDDLIENFMYSWKHIYDSYTIDDIETLIQKIQYEYDQLLYNMYELSSGD